MLSLAGNLVGNMGAMAIAELLVHRSRLISVDLRTNGISDFGATVLFGALHVKNTVVSLNLSSVSGVARNSLGRESIIEMSSMLLQNQVEYRDDRNYRFRNGRTGGGFG
jgi:hypothetical protein